MSDTQPVIEVVESTVTQPETPKVNSFTPKETIQNDTGYAALIHLGGIFFSFIPSLIVYLCIDSNNSWLKDQAKEALNFQISMAIYWAIVGLLWFISILLMIILIGFALAFIMLIVSFGLGIFCLICPIIAACSTGSNQPFRYPLTIRFLK